MSIDDFKEFQAQTTPHPIGMEVDRAEGVFIWDKNGKRYYDLVSGLAVTNIGHCHPRILKAIREQSEKYMHVMPYGEFVQEPQTLLAKKLNALLPAGLDCSYFVNSGTEANEGALKLAKRYTGRSEILSFKGSYHGSSHGSLSVTGNEKKKYAFRPLLPDVRFLEFNNIQDLEQISLNTACVIIEPIQGDAGVRIPSREFMLALREKCTASGAILIFDEIQTGFGRTGTMFAFEQFNVQPDILTIAKAFGGGMPIGAFISSKEIMASLMSRPMLGHITTFGGHPVNCAAAHANIEVIEEERIIESVEAKGALIEELIQHESIVEIRRVGLMFAIEFPDEQWVEKLFYKNLEMGSITFWFLSCRNSLRLAPLTIPEEQITEFCQSFNKCMEMVTNEMTISS
ncbi:MAG: aspartate aminotransferase family protein [Flavobacteriales bacterium]|nr:aspartate aminotransferase family protein [Flavobacteriales bacterium]